MYICINIHIYICKLNGPDLGLATNLCHENCWFQNGEIFVFLSSPDFVPDSGLILNIKEYRDQNVV